MQLSRKILSSAPARRAAPPHPPGAPATPRTPGAPAARSLPVAAWLWGIGGGMLVAGLAALAIAAWLFRYPEVAPRHRPEALCFALARSRFSPPMAVEPSSALVRGRFGPTTTAGYALREVMNLSDRMVLSEERRRVGDFDVSVLWLRLPGEDPTTHWLIVGWMEGTDLAVCNFRFAGSSRSLQDDEKEWGRVLLDRILTEENFQSGVMPPVRLRAAQGAALPSFGPASRG